MTKEMQNLKNKIVKTILDAHKTLMWNEDAIQRFEENIDKAQDVMTRMKDHYTCVVNLLNRLSKSQKLRKKESTLIQVLSYLIIAEGGVCNLLNYLSHLLVIMGHDLYSLTKRKYVKADMEEIRKVEMSTKIKFLNNHGFRELTKDYDSTFRNDIAHHNYMVDDEGVLWVRGQPVDLRSKTDSLLKIMLLVGVAGEEATRKTIRKLK